MIKRNTLCLAKDSKKKKFLKFPKFLTFPKFQKFLQCCVFPYEKSNLKARKRKSMKVPKIPKIKRICYIHLKRYANVKSQKNS